MLIKAALGMWFYGQTLNISWTNQKILKRIEKKRNSRQQLKFGNLNTCYISSDYTMKCIEGVLSVRFWFLFIFCHYYYFVKASINIERS